MTSAYVCADTCYFDAAGLAGGSTSRNAALDGHDIWTSLTTGGKSPRTEMLYNVNPLCNSGQAVPPKAGIRMGSYKLLSWCYNVAGYGNATTTGKRTPAQLHVYNLIYGTYNLHGHT